MFFQVLDLPPLSYKETLNLQHKIVQKKIDNPTQLNLLITIEHRPVYTIGKHANFSNLKISKESLKEKNIEFVQSDRGGDITYHCPGQLTLYTIVNLKEIKTSLKNFVYLLEDTIIETLERFNIKSYKLNNLHGVFTDYGKIASIGLACKKMIVYHGVSLNINNNLEPFNWINPCGLKNITMTSMKSILKQEISLIDVKKSLLEIFSFNCGCELVETQYSELGIIENDKKTFMA
jgi:lipoate-protein ligase B